MISMLLNPPSLRAVGFFLKACETQMKGISATIVIPKNGFSDRNEFLNCAVEMEIPFIGTKEINSVSKFMYAPYLLGHRGPSKLESS